jgi:parvulin-like peptidyl-prolyl isomerase
VILIPLILSSCQVSPGSKAEGGGDGVAAVVNGTKILVADVDRVVTQQLRGQEEQFSPLDRADARLQALDNLIQREVLFQRAQKENLNPTEDEITQFIQRTKQEGGLTEEAFQQQLKQANQTEAQLRDDVRKQLAIGKLQDKMAAQLTVKDQEVEDFFKANPKQFVAQPGVQVSDIIADPNDNGMKNDVRDALAAEQKSKEIYTRLKNGADFATIARQQSEHESALKSGDLGFIPQEQFTSLTQQGLPANLGARLMDMKEGDITEPIKDSAGRWHIFKLTGKRTESRNLTLNDPEVRKQISDFILNQRKQLVNSALLTRARDESKIENYLAKRMLENPNTFGVLRPVTPATAESATPAPIATPLASPSAVASPAAKK